MIKKISLCFVIAASIVGYIEWLKTGTEVRIVKVQVPTSINFPRVEKFNSFPSEYGVYLDQEVIGIVIDGHPRAYVLQSFVYKPGMTTIGPGVHIVNDDLAGTPISVTYCDQADQIKVLDREPEKLMKVYGFDAHSEEMVIEYDGKAFNQSHSGQEVREREYHRMKLRDWVDLHPETELYVGLAGTSEKL